MPLRRILTHLSKTTRTRPAGFPPGTPLEFRCHDNELAIAPAVLANNHVSSRRIAGGRRPIIDVADAGVLKPITDFSELKIRAWHRRIHIHASERAAAILRARSLSPPFRVLEMFTGGGTMSGVLFENANYRMVAGIEIERIHGIHSGTSDYSVGTQILGQGVLARPMREIFIQIGRFLTQSCRRESGE